MWTGSRQSPLLAARQHAVLNAVVFQLAWLLCVLGGNLVALPVTAGALALHLWLSTHRGAETRVLLAAIAVGLLCDSLLINSGVLLTPGMLPPLWLLCLWPLFASTLGLALRWFRDRLPAAAVGGLVFAPMSYFGGSRIAGIELLAPEWLALLVIGLAWSLVFPLLILIHRRLSP
ncbi:MAG: DUF2878 domain-containing protein [Pseudomonadota bacterium]